jgi:hypothetical protein
VNRTLRNVLVAAALAVATHAAAQVTFYELEGFHGRSITTSRMVGNFERIGFDDRASSLVVRGTRWEVCEDAGFEGRCAVLRPGNYPSLAGLGLDKRISSARAVGRNERVADERYAPVATRKAAARGLTARASRRLRAAA